MTMRVIPIVPRGFCPGVVHAIRLVEQALKDPHTEKPIYVLGMIVHNRHVVDKLNAEGAIFLDDALKTKAEWIDSISSGTIIITAHGVAPHLVQRIHEKGLSLIDGTCRDVTRTHELIRNHLQLGFQIIYIGKRHHPESSAVCGIDPGIILVESVEDISNLMIPNPNIFVTNQTTFSQYDIQPILDAIGKQFPEAIIQNEICDSTRVRQQAITQFNHDVDLCYIVGDPKSNNTRNLAKVSAEVTQTNTIQIQSVADIDTRDLIGVETVSVSSGASTPPELTKAVIDFLTHYQGK